MMCKHISVACLFVSLSLTKNTNATNLYFASLCLLTKKYKQVSWSFVRATAIYKCKRTDVLRHLIYRNTMKIYDWDNSTDFEFECDLVINNDFVAEFDTNRVHVITDLLKEHGITDWQIRVGMNERLQQTVRISVFANIPEEFYYDLTTLQLTWS